jgi:MoaA/NifB/PqqE/SkfB family radical SAM enzyme
MFLKLNRYRIDEPGDSLLTRITRRLTTRPIPAFPRTVQVETIAACNADCVWCPYGKLHPMPPTGRMPADRYERIVEECARRRVLRFSPYLTNEPFLDPDIHERLALAHREMPWCKIVLTTNGSRLTPEVTDRLLSLDGALHSLYISFQGIAKKGYEDTMRGNLRFERVLANVNHLLEQMRVRRISRPKIWITMVSTNIVDAPRAVAYWRSRGVRSKYTALENRGGNISEADGMSVGAMDYYDDCTRLFKQAYISFDGAMVICCTDYGRKHVLGNVFDGGIEKVWKGPVAEDLRRRFLTGRIHTIALCSVCRVDREREVAA